VLDCVFAIDLRAAHSGRFTAHAALCLNAAMSKDETIRTEYTYIKANENDPVSKPVVFIFLSFDRKLKGEECQELAQKYFDTHFKTTLPGEPLIVDLRPAFQKPLSEVTPKFSRG
jgi:hypothetical protein